MFVERTLKQDKAEYLKIIKYSIWCASTAEERWQPPWWPALTRPQLGWRKGRGTVSPRCTSSSAFFPGHRAAAFPAWSADQEMSHPGTDRSTFIHSRTAPFQSKKLWIPETSGGKATMTLHSLFFLNAFPFSSTKHTYSLLASFSDSFPPQEPEASVPRWDPSLHSWCVCALESPRVWAPTGPLIGHKITRWLVWTDECGTARERSL